MVVLNLGGDAPLKPEPATPPIVTVVGDEPVAPGASGRLDVYVGERVRAEGVSVQRVPVDEGFWVGSGGGSVMWVKLSIRGESAVEIDPGDSISFYGVVRRNPPKFAAAQGVEGADAQRLRAQGHHIVVSAGDVRLLDR